MAPPSRKRKGQMTESTRPSKQAKNPSDDAVKPGKPGNRATRQSLVNRGRPPIDPLENAF